jgi:hypothetical protein
VIVAVHPAASQAAFHFTQKEGSAIFLACVILAFLVLRALWRRARANRQQSQQRHRATVRY